MRQPRQPRPPRPPRPPRTHPSPNPKAFVSPQNPDPPELTAAMLENHLKPVQVLLTRELIQASLDKPTAIANMQAVHPHLSSRSLANYLHPNSKVCRTVRQVLDQYGLSLDTLIKRMKDHVMQKKDSRLSLDAVKDVLKLGDYYPAAKSVSLEIQARISDYEVLRQEAIELEEKLLLTDKTEETPLLTNT